ncbi:MAG TPA: hypothetical protein VIY72_14795 [Acidimicrobiales bacterium]
MDELSRQLVALVDATEPVEIDEVLTRPVASGPPPSGWRRPVLVAAAAVLALLVAGGVLLLVARTDDGSRTRVATETPAVPTTDDAPDTTTPPPTSAVPPVTVPAVLDRTQLSTDGVGSLAFGDPLEEAEALTGVKARLLDCGDSEGQVIEIDGATLWFGDGEFRLWDVRGPGWSTVSGVTVGMPADEVVARVPSLERGDSGSGGYLAFPPLPTNFLVTLDADDRVDDMFASMARALLPASELCW